VWKRQVVTYIITLFTLVTSISSSRKPCRAASSEEYFDYEQEEDSLILSAGCLPIRVCPIIVCISQDTHKDKDMTTDRKPQLCLLQKEPSIYHRRLAGLRKVPRFKFHFDVSRMRLSVTAFVQWHQFCRRSNPNCVDILLILDPSSQHPDLEILGFAQQARVQRKIKAIRPSPEISGAELRKKSRIYSKRRGLRSTKTTPLAQQILPAQLLESIVAKNGDRSSVDLSVVNERPPTFIVNASVIVVAVLRQMRIVDELQRCLCRCITKIAST
jgi:hypothetical protein